MAIVRITETNRSDFEVFSRQNPVFANELANLRDLRTRRLARLSELPRRIQRSRVRDLLTNKQLLRLYAYEALRKSNNLRAATVAQIDEMAAEANLFRPCRERSPRRYVGVRQRQREVFSFGPEKRLRQMLVADLLRSLHPPRRSQTLLHGGMPAARAAVEAAYFDNGMRYCAEVDFVDFYGSIPWDGLADTLRPLPERVVRHVVYDTTIRRSYEGEDASASSSVSWSHPHRIGPAGLPLGSACSPVVGECILAQFLREISSDRYVAYADNVLFLGRDPADVAALTDSFGEVVQNSSGSMRFRVGSTVPLDADFDFLGQYASLADDGESFVWRPSAGKIAEYRIGEQVPESSPEQIDIAERQIINWRLAYPDWPEGGEVEARCLAEVASLRYFQQRTRISHRRAISAILDAAQASNYALSIDEIVPDAAPQYAAERDRLIQSCLDRFPETQTAAE